MRLSREFVPRRKYKIEFNDCCIQGNLELTFKYYLVYDIEERDFYGDRPTICVDYQMLKKDAWSGRIFDEAVFEEGMLSPSWGAWGCSSTDTREDSV